VFPLDRWLKPNGNEIGASPCVSFEQPSEKDLMRGVLDELDTVKS
jgi:hypothetical protein